MCGDNIGGDGRIGPRESLAVVCVFIFLVFNGANPPMANVCARRTRHYRSSFLLVQE